MKKLFFLSSGLLLYSCNMSDSVEKLPHEYEFVYEGGNQNRLIRNHKLIIDSGIVECKYNDDYLLISVDTTYSMNPGGIEKKNLQYFIQDLKRDTIIQKISFIDLQRLIKKENSVKDIDISK